jgi:hypothetical protein
MGASLEGTELGELTFLEQVVELLPLLIPLLLVQAALVIAALWDLVKRPATRGPKWIWVLVILFVNTIGPIAYFIVGRGEDV